MISVIIPAFNEEESIHDLIKYLFDNGKDHIEVILVDGGSTDTTREVAKAAGANVIQSPKKGRAKQMNFGANHAKYELLYFLHADTYPPKTFVADIIAEHESGYESGCYRLSFDNDHPILKFYSWFTRFDFDIFRFGDQSLFVRKDVFEKAGRFDESLIVMEDQEIVRELKKVSKFNIIKKAVITSARKYEKIGFVKLQFRFTSVLTMYYLGVDQQKLIDFYFRKIR
jgi:rSAM/selenodomain-associated transferase 2